MTEHTAEMVIAVRTGVEAHDWREAVRLAAEPLLRAGAVAAQYADRCIATVDESGPYIVVAPGIALAHARPEDGARAVALSLLRLASPVSFGHPDNDPVRLLFLFAAPRGDKHVVMLGRLARALIGGLGARLEAARDDAETSALLEEAIQGED